MSTKKVVKKSVVVRKPAAKTVVKEAAAPIKKSVAAKSLALPETGRIQTAEGWRRSRASKEK